MKSKATEFAENTFLISRLTPSEFTGDKFWNYMQSTNWNGLELELVFDHTVNNIFLRDSEIHFSAILRELGNVIDEDESKIIPVFIHYSGEISQLDAIINASELNNHIFFLPQGERWPSMEYLVQANRRIIFFIESSIRLQSKVLHQTSNYTLEIAANQITSNSVILNNESNINKELFKISNFDQLPVNAPSEIFSRELYPGYINYLLENWTKYGKKPNFLFVGENIYNFAFIIEQLNSFEVIEGQVRTTGKNLDRVYWKNAETLITGGKFSFPIRGGEEMLLTPFVPGYNLIPSQLTITGEMVMPEKYDILANPLNLNAGLMASFYFDNKLINKINPDQDFEGVGYSFSQDIDRGNVLRLPEDANINLGNPQQYGLPNSSFTISCFVKFTEILDYGDNAILGNDEEGYRKGFHLVLRSGHPYFGLWANDFMSERTLRSNKWYHLTWRYILETGQQAIFVDGQYVGGSDGHPPYSGTSDIHIGSAYSAGASLRGYIDNLRIWDRPLGNEEINRLALDEEIDYDTSSSSTKLFKSTNIVIILICIALLSILLILIFLRKANARKQSILVDKPDTPTKNQIQLFGKFKAVNKEDKDVTDMFTPKIKELFLFTLINTLKNGMGAPISEINKTLWYGIDAKKVANNRAVTLNKLRKILVQFDKIEIHSNNGYLQLKISESFFCDYIEMFHLSKIPEGMSRSQLQLFFHLVKKGRLLKGADWPWLDEIRGFTGNQVIDNLLKLAAAYKNENRPKEVEEVSQRILDYDDMNEEALYLQIWALQETNNSHLAKFNFESFCSKYENIMGESFSMKFKEFTQHYTDQL
ncbi:MAG TPA: LamG-like jellyroll fold domain-containing protein [Draconibacterium sp.]|nr:LamG-like jellyroll fold domain-containing protein [Draconibacterium sp.]